MKHNILPLLFIIFLSSCTSTRNNSHSNPLCADIQSSIAYLIKNNDLRIKAHDLFGSNIESFEIGKSTIFPFYSSFSHEIKESKMDYLLTQEKEKLNYNMPINCRENLTKNRKSELIISFSIRKYNILYGEIRKKEWSHLYKMGFGHIISFIIIFDDNNNIKDSWFNTVSFL